MPDALAMSTAGQRSARRRRNLALVAAAALTALVTMGLLAWLTIDLLLNAGGGGCEGQGPRASRAAEALLDEVAQDLSPRVVGTRGPACDTDLDRLGEIILRPGTSEERVIAAFVDAGCTAAEGRSCRIRVANVSAQVRLIERGDRLVALLTAR